MDGDLWRGAAPDRLLVRPLDAMTLVYDRASGQTHLLASPLPELLAVLADALLDTHGVVAALAVQYDVAADATPIIAERLHELASLGLVDRC